MGLPQRLAEESPSGSCIPLGQEQEVDALSSRIDGTVQINPFALHPNVGFIHGQEPLVIRR
jgi:hypothetical protein